MSENGQPDKANADAGRFYLTKLHLENFTAFRDIEISFSPGVNVFIGENATGKTHLLKVIYLCCKYRTGKTAQNVRVYNDYFHLADADRWNIRNEFASEHEVRLEADSSRKSAWAVIKDRANGVPPSNLKYRFSGDLGAGTSNAVYIPVKEMLSHSPGFLEDYERFHLSFEREHSDILVFAGSSKLRELSDLGVRQLLDRIEAILGGHVERIGQVYFLQYSTGFRLEITLVAEGHRKFCLLWLLLRNGSIDSGNLLLVDEPEANLNPKLIGEMAGIILAIQRLGVQVFLATHSYLLVKEMELQAEAGKDELLFHSLYRDPDDETFIRCKSVRATAEIEHNPILDAYRVVYDKQLKKAIPVGENGDLD